MDLKYHDMFLEPIAGSLADLELFDILMQRAPQDTTIGSVLQTFYGLRSIWWDWVRSKYNRMKHDLLDDSPYDSPCPWWRTFEDSVRLAGDPLKDTEAEISMKVKEIMSR